MRQGHFDESLKVVFTKLQQVAKAKRQNVYFTLQCKSFTLMLKITLRKMTVCDSWITFHWNVHFHQI